MITLHESTHSSHVLRLTVRDGGSAEILFSFHFVTAVKGFGGQVFVLRAADREFKTTTMHVNKWLAGSASSSSVDRNELQSRYVELLSLYSSKMNV